MTARPAAPRRSRAAVPVKGAPGAEEGAPAWAPFLAGIAVAAGVILRVAFPTRLPSGPWIDEVCAIRAARTLLASGGWSPFGTSPILPPEAGFVGAWESNLLLLFTGAVDRLAGGGMASVRSLSIGPCVALFLAALFLAAEVLRGRSRAFAFAAVLLAGSGWLLRMGRWGWFDLGTAALLTLSLALALGAARTARLVPAVGAGILLGLAQYGYLVSRAGLVFALLAVAVTFALRNRRPATAAFQASLAVAGTALLVALPLFVHLARSPDRATERIRDLAPAGGAAALPAALLRNAADLAGLFFGAGDPIRRHGEPGSPVFPLPVAIAVAAGVVEALRAGGAARTAALAALALLAPNLATKGGVEAVNSFRVLAAAAPLLVLGAGACDRLAGAAGRWSPRLGAVSVAALLSGAALVDVARFVRWGRDPATAAAFSVPERSLADRLRALGAGRDADVLVSSRAADERTTVVEVLLGAPGSAARGVRVEPGGLPGLSPHLAFVPQRDLLFVDVDVDSGSDPAAGVRPGARLVGRIPAGEGRRPLRAFRMTAADAREAADEALRSFPRREATPDGDLVAEEDGLCRVDESVGGRTRSALVHLARGRHRSADLLSPGGRLEGFTGTDGFPRRLSP